MAVTVVYAGAADADLNSTHANHLGAISGTTPPTTPASVASELWVGQLQFGTFSVYQSFVDFNLSGIHAGQVATSALLQMWLVTDQSATDFNVVVIGYDWGASVTSADWRTNAQLAGQTWWSTLPTAGIGAVGAYKSFTDNPGGIRDLVTTFAGTELNFVLTTDQVVAGNSPPGAQFVQFSSSDVAGTTQDPKLTITHADDVADSPHTVKGALEVGDGRSTVGVYSSPNAPTAQVAADLVVEWDFDNDGDFSDPLEDITEHVLGLETVTGREFPSGLTGETRPGSLKLTLDNSDGRFAYFNTASPLTAPPMSLRAGRKIRVRTATAVADDPVLLARDRYDRADGVLGVTETGQSWATAAGIWAIRAGTAAATAAGVENIATVDVGTTDQYVQVELRQLPHSNDQRRAGVVGRFVDLNNYTRARLDTLDGTVYIIDVNAGVATTIANTAVGAIAGFFEGIVIGLGFVGTRATAYINGVAVCSATSARAVAGNRAGIYAVYPSFTGRSSEIADFHVWDGLAGEVDGILWTGDVTDLEVEHLPGGVRVASVAADGVLARLAHVEIAAPRLPILGAKTGQLVGNVLHRAGMLHPPAPLDGGAVTTGPVGVPDAKALDLARMFEDTEQGTVVETNEGQVSFQDSTARATAIPRAWFSDTPGVGSLPYSSITPVDRRGQLINRVTAGVAAEAPSGITWTQQNGNNHVDITMPTVNDGDLLVIFIAASHDGGQDWLTPIWWDNHRDAKGARSARIYSHWCNGTEDATVVRFRQWNGVESGLWIAHIFRIENWFESGKGIALSDSVAGSDPGALVHGWGRKPTLFLVAVTAIAGGPGGILYGGTLNPPDGYDWTTGIGGIVSSGPDIYDAGILTAYKIDVTDEENPTEFFGLTNAFFHEATVFAIRGFDGEHTKATLENPQTVGGKGRTVTVDNLESQAAFNAVLDHRSPADLFRTESEAEAYGQSVVDQYGDERPIVEISFYATSSIALRTQAIARRVGDMVTLTANDLGFTGAGLGFERRFFIENISHKVTDGGMLWAVTWQLSPAA